MTRWLGANKYNDPKKAFALGRSAGGLLMGAIANMAPADYAGIVTGVPFVDVVTTMLDESIPLTTNEFDEWGNPKDKKFYDYMLAYSPYDQLGAHDYPAMFVHSGLWDSQVQYYEPTKYVARLRARRTGDSLVVLRTNMEAGHGGKSGRYEHFREYAEQYAFILDQAGIRQLNGDASTGTAARGLLADESQFSRSAAGAARRAGRLHGAPPSSQSVTDGERFEAGEVDPGCRAGAATMRSPRGRRMREHLQASCGARPSGSRVCGALWPRAPSMREFARGFLRAAARSRIASCASRAASARPRGLVTGYYEPLLRGLARAQRTILDATVLAAPMTCSSSIWPPSSPSSRANGCAAGSTATRWCPITAAPPPARRPDSPATRSCGSTTRSTPSCSRCRARAACS